MKAYFLKNNQKFIQLNVKNLFIFIEMFEYYEKMPIKFKLEIKNMRFSQLFEFDSKFVFKSPLSIDGIITQIHFIN